MTEPIPFPIYGEPIFGRACGGCHFCCTHVPVKCDALDKPAGTRCQHLFSKGCRIYARRPTDCRYWSCRWLFDPLTSNMRRPDHSGFAVDPILDTLLGDDRAFEAFQIWADPRRTDVTQDPELRSYLAAMAAKYEMPAIVRWGSSQGVLLVAPCLSSAGEWLELGKGTMLDEAAMNAKLAAAGERRLLERPQTKVVGR